MLLRKKNEILRFYGNRQIQYDLFKPAIVFEYETNQTISAANFH